MSVSAAKELCNSLREFLSSCKRELRTLVRDQPRCGQPDASRCTRNNSDLIPHIHKPDSTPFTVETPDLVVSNNDARTPPFIRLDIYDEGSIHADVVGGRESIGLTATTAPRPVVRGFRWWKRRARGAVAKAEHHPMAKSNPVNETRFANPVEPAKRQSRANVKEARRTAKAQKRRTRSKDAIGGRNGTRPPSGKTDQTADLPRPARSPERCND